MDNLFGVDIMEEAVEICKLRLFHDVNTPKRLLMMMDLRMK